PPRPGALTPGWGPGGPGPARASGSGAPARRAAEAESRNRLARELHDSVGHALSAVTLQAGAARRVLDGGDGADLAFVREALTAIEETTRRTVGELDWVLGLLRQDEQAGAARDAGEAGAGGPGPGPGLDALESLVRGAGPTVALTVSGGLATVPEALSREAYRIVQEGLTNAARHAGGEPVSVRLDARTEEWEISMENPLPARPPVARPNGGRGLRGIGERARLLGGTAEAGPADGVWRLVVRIPR
ncbi:sensor histidine kinase, partial [Streptomyces sp. NPDC059556]|uniref:sensor histidine kinase n=1 Tax=Streptomyces sp. NPDC059556 TaxID=3346863 RepID=UPI0036B89890